MADTTQDLLLERFNEAADGLTQSLDSVGGSASAGGSVPQSSGTGSESASSGGSSSSGSDSSGGGGSEALSIATTVLESGLGIVPLVASLIGIFTGGGSHTPTPLVKYAMPAKMQFEGADASDGMSDSDFDQMGMPREYSGSPGGTPSTSPATTPGGATSGGSAAAQITVNVQAMDARSFMDYSNEIAQAVRSAMLNSNSINDVVSDL